MGVGGLLLWWLANKVAAASDAAFLTNVTAATVVLRAAWSFVQHNVIGQYYYLIAADTRGRFVNACQLAQAWHEGLWLPALPTNLSESHNILIDLKTTFLIYLFGPSPILSEAFTIIINASICIAVYLICRHVKATPLATRIAVLLNAFLPSLLFWSTQDLKDPILAACGVWALLAMFKLSDHRGRGTALFLLVVANVVALIYRPYVGILLIVGQGLAFAYTLRLPKTALGRMARVGIFLALVPAVFYFGVSEMRDTYSSMGINGTNDLQWAVDSSNEFRTAAAEHGGSAYEIPITASTPTMAIIQLPIRILLLLLTPIPIFPGSLAKMLLFPEMWFIYLWVVPRFAKGVREAWRKNPQALMGILLMVGPVITAYALKTSISGEAARMRVQFLPELLIFAGIGHAVMQRERLAAREARQRKLHWIQPKQQPSQEETAS